MRSDWIWALSWYVVLSIVRDCVVMLGSYNEHANTTETLVTTHHRRLLQSTGRSYSRAVLIVFANEDVVANRWFG